nr:ABC transporter substrate-binding protein [Marinicella sp. W31]MDC2880296.1 ABC transporter substrate-binding protein [Marinicella sp. W31]
MQDLSIGFVPLLDSAIVLAAEARGFFVEEGLNVRLTRETSWSAIRDRLAVGNLQAAHILAPMPIAANLGLFPLSSKLIAPIALGLGGNAVTVLVRTWPRNGGCGRSERSRPGNCRCSPEAGDREAQG